MELLRQCLPEKIFWKLNDFILLLQIYNNAELRS